MDDSRKETLAHKDRVEDLLCIIINEIRYRAMEHDNSKLASPEKELFDKYTPMLSLLVYGSEEYKQVLAELKPALDHHYAVSKHHPEFVYADEEWVDIYGYEGIYQISNHGRIKRLAGTIHRHKQGDFSCSENILKCHITPKGYYRLQLQHNNKHRNILVHRLVAQHFVSNDDPIHKIVVNHIDGIKHHNHYTNLEWVTPSYNQKHAYNLGLRKPRTKYVVTCTELDITTLGCYKMEQALKQYGYDITAGSILAYINGKRKHPSLTFISHNLSDDYYIQTSPINKMTLIDLIEMFCDWKAAGERHAGGNFAHSIQINKDRFGMSEQLVEVFENTRKALGW